MDVVKKQLRDRYYSQA